MSLYTQLQAAQSEEEVDAPDRFESDFMVQYLADKILSAEATAVLDAGRTQQKRRHHPRQLQTF